MALADATDTAVTPAATDDFYAHVNGRWLREVELPADKARYGTFDELRDASEAAAREILESVDATAAASGTPARQIADLYRSFMDEEAVESRGLAAITEQLAPVDAVTDVEGLVGLIGIRQRAAGSGAFRLGVDTDPGNPDAYVVELFQGGLGLPDESYYRDEQYAPIRADYVRHIAAMLSLAGVPDAQRRAESVMTLETDLAAAHWTRVDSRDRDKTYNPMQRPALQELTPALRWSAYLDAIGAPPSILDRSIVYQPSYFQALSALLTADRLPDWQDWLRWKIVHDAAPYAPAALVEENFAFYGKTLTGTPQLKERWKRGVGLVEHALGEALGQIYVQRHFPPAAKERIDALVANLVEAYRRNIAELPWMSAATKAKAQEKLRRFTPKVGFPVRWRDYSSIRIDPADLLGNVRRAEEFEVRRELAKLGSPVDRDEWFMTPQVVNAYYNPGMNEIVFPAAILQPPFFDADGDDATNYGAIGAVIGHEIGHGFDDQGSKYDGAGALANWWTDADRSAFEELTRRLIAQYSALEPSQAPGHQVNGALAIGENIGDVGGLAIAYQAWQISLAGDASAVIDGVTGAQRFFAAWATIWRTKARDAEVIRLLAVDPHSPGEFRCNQVVRNTDAFYPAYGVAEDHPMWLPEADRVHIW